MLRKRKKNFVKGPGKLFFSVTKWLVFVPRLLLLQDVLLLLLLYLVRVCFFFFFAFRKWKISFSKRRKIFLRIEKKD